LVQLGGIGNSDSHGRRQVGYRHSSSCPRARTRELWLGSVNPSLLALFLDRMVNGGQVGLLHRTVEPGVHLDPLAQKGFQDWITWLALQHRGRSDVPRRASELTR